MPNNQKGFTLIELLIVIVILGILSSMAMFSLGSKGEEAKITKAKVDIKTISSAIELYKVENGKYPSTSEWNNNPNLLVEKKYLKKIPKDPWNNSYIYTSDESTFTITDGTGKNISSEDL